MSTLQKTATITLYIIAAISVGIAFWFFFGPKVAGTANTNFEEPVATSAILVWGFILLIIAGAILVAFTLINVITQPNALKNTLIVLGIAALLVIVSYSLASGNPLPDHEGVAYSTLKWVDTGLYATYILGVLAFLGIIFTEVYRATR